MYHENCTKKILVYLLHELGEKGVPNVRTGKNLTQSPYDLYRSSTFRKKMVFALHEQVFLLHELKKKRVYLIHEQVKIWYKDCTTHST